MFTKRLLSVSVVSLLIAVGFITPASATYDASTDHLSGSVQVNYANSVTANSQSPALTVEAFGIYLSSNTSQSIQIQIRPAALADYSASWPSNGWVNKASCPVVGANATSTAADCGISAIYINDVAVDLTKLKFWSQSTSSSTEPDATGNDVDTIPGTVIARFIDAVNSKFVPALSQNAIVRVEMSAGAWDLGAGAALAPNWQIRSTRIDGGSIGFAIQDKRAVIFKANGGTGDSYTQSRYTNQPQTLLPNRFTRSGFTFTGWNTDPNGNGTGYAAGESYPFAVSQTLYAQWRDDSVSGGSSGGSSGSNGSSGSSSSSTSTGTVVDSATIFFNPNSAKLTPGAIRVLNRISNSYKSGYTIEVTGYVQTSKNNRNIQPLSNRRAKAIADYLQSKGVTSTINQSGKGLHPDMPKRAKARQASITIRN